jgi:hypothetical protein
MPVIAYFMSGEITPDPQLMRMVAPTRLIRALGNPAWSAITALFMTVYSDGFKDE